MNHCFHTGSSPLKKNCLNFWQFGLFKLSQKMCFLPKKFSNLKFVDFTKNAFKVYTKFYICRYTVYFLYLRVLLKVYTKDLYLYFLFLIIFFFFPFLTYSILKCSAIFFIFLQTFRSWSQKGENRVGEEGGVWGEGK